VAVIAARRSLAPEHTDQARALRAAVVVRCCTVAKRALRAEGRTAGVCVGGESSGCVEREQRGCDGVTACVHFSIPQVAAVSGRRSTTRVSSGWLLKTLQP